MQKAVRTFLCFFTFLLLVSTSCNQQGEGVDWRKPSYLIAQGQIRELCAWVDSVKQVVDLHSSVWMKADSLEQIGRRLRLEFCLDEEAVRNKLEQEIGSYSAADLRRWEQSGMLEWRYIDGEKYFFKRAVSNLKLMRGEGNSLINSGLRDFCIEHASEVVKQVGDLSKKQVMPHKFDVEYSVELEADAVPDGEVVRCWLPFPKASHSRQVEVRLNFTSDSSYLLAADSCVHKTIYMERKAVAGQATCFKVGFTYSSFAEYHNLQETVAAPSNLDSGLVQFYTAEVLPHVAFTESLKSLTDSICGAETDPTELVKRIYFWIDSNIIWAGALEYSTMANIPQYVLEHRRGDCGMQTLLFMAMARYKGIPVKWQSGWMLHPDEVNLHDWCEVYYQGIGWVPLDMSFGLQESSDKEVKEFYMSGIDSYRLIVNDGIGGALVPPKRFLRSEPWDFQRGELEWDGGNLYFDKWQYRLRVK